jgi:hypothetical protein
MDSMNPAITLAVDLAAFLPGADNYLTMVVGNVAPTQAGVTYVMTIEMQEITPLTGDFAKTPVLTGPVGAAGAAGAPGVTGAAGADGSNTVDVLVNYLASTDLLSATGIAAGTWTDVTANQAFTKAAGGTAVYIAVSGVITLTAGDNAATRVVVDSAGTPLYRMVGGTGLVGDANPLAGANVIAVTGLAAGAHTIKLQLYTLNAGTAYLRAASSPNLEYLTISVWEA